MSPFNVLKWNMVYGGENLDRKLAAERFEAHGGFRHIVRKVKQS